MRLTDKFYLTKSKKSYKINLYRFKNIRETQTKLWRKTLKQINLNPGKINSASDRSINQRCISKRCKITLLNLKHKVSRYEGRKLIKLDQN